MREFNSQNNFSDTVHLIMTGFDSRASPEVIKTVLSDFGHVTGLQVFHALDNGSFNDTYCKASFSNSETARRALLQGQSCYQGTVIHIQMLQSVFPSIEDREPDSVRSLLSDENEDKYLEIRENRIALCKEKLLLRTETEILPEVIKDMSSFKKMLKETLASNVQVTRRPILEPEYNIKLRVSRRKTGDRVTKLIFPDRSLKTAPRVQEL